MSSKRSYRVRPVLDNTQTRANDWEWHGDLGEVFVEGFGVSVGKKSERLVVRRKGETIFERPFFEVDRVTVATEGATISSSAVHECVKNGIPTPFHYC